MGSLFSPISSWVGKNIFHSNDDSLTQFLNVLGTAAAGAGVGSAAGAALGTAGGATAGAGAGTEVGTGAGLGAGTEVGAGLGAGTTPIGAGLGGVPATSGGEIGATIAPTAIDTYLAPSEGAAVPTAMDMSPYSMGISPNVDLSGGYPNPAASVDVSQMGFSPTPASSNLGGYLNSNTLINTGGDYPYGFEQSGTDTGLIPDYTNQPQGPGMLSRAYNAMGNNKMLTAMLGLGGLNAFNSWNQSAQMRGINNAQQQSYNDYLNTLNPPDTTKQARYQTLLGNVNKTAGQTEQNVMGGLAARGIRGHGLAGPTGDLSEANRQARNSAYNQIYGTYTVPGAPGPAASTPSAGQTALGTTTQLSNYLLPLLAMSQYYKQPTA